MPLSQFIRSRTIFAWLCMAPIVVASDGEAAVRSAFDSEYRTELIQRVSGIPSSRDRLSFLWDQEKWVRSDSSIDIEARMKRLLSIGHVALRSVGNPMDYAYLERLLDDIAETSSNDLVRADSLRMSGQCAYRTRRFDIAASKYDAVLEILRSHRGAPDGG